jgi:hypothetical protein
LSSPTSPIPEHHRDGPVSRPRVDGAGPTVASIARFELGSQKSESTILVVELVFSCRHISSLIRQLFGVCLVVSIPRPHAATLEFDFGDYGAAGFFSCAFEGV